MAYTPPAGNAVNFALTSFTPPAGNAVNFEMNEQEAAYYAMMVTMLITGGFM